MFHPPKMKIDKTISAITPGILVDPVATVSLPESIAFLGASQQLTPKSNRRLRTLSAKGILAIAGLLAAETLPSAPATTATFDLGAFGSPTTIYGNIFIPWSLGVVPAGNFLQSVSINSTIESTNQDNWASELMFLVQQNTMPPGCGSDGGILEIGPDWGADPSNGATTRIFWPSSGNSGPVSTVADSKFAIIDFPSTINLSTSNLFLMNAFGPGYGAWSGSITITYGAAPSNLTWTGADPTSPTQWSTAPGVLNWSGGAAFTDGSTTLFDDSVGAGSRLVQISNGDVSPIGITVNTVGAYTFSGTNAITGAAGLTKQGTGLLTVNNANSYSGPTLISSGTLKLGNAAALPHGTGKGPVRVDSILDLNGFSSTVDGLLGTGTVTSSAAGNITLTAGETNATSVFTGIIQDGTGQIGLTKIGTGTLTLTGFNTYSGTTSINAGILSVGSDESLGSTGAVGAILTFNGGTLEITANFNSDRRINVVAAGGNFHTNGLNATLSGVISGVGTLTKTGAGILTLNPVADLTALGGLTSGGGTTLVNGPLGNGSSVASATNGGHLAFGTTSQTLASLNIGAGSTVSFSGGAASAFGSPGFKSTANVPEPGTIGLLLVGALGMLGRCRRD